MAYQRSKRVMIMKIEGTPGTAETLAAADFDCMIYDATFEPAYEMDSGLKVSTPDSGKYEDIIGGLIKKATGEIKMTPPSAANAAPKYGKFLRASGHIGAAHTTVGYSYTPLQAGERVSCTIWIVDITRGGTPTGIAHKMAGAMMDVEIMAPGIGKPVSLKFSATGKEVATADLDNAALTTLAAFTAADTVQPYIMTSAAMVVEGVTQKISSFSLKSGLDLQPEENSGDDTGYDLFSIADRNPQLTYNPLKQAVAAYDAEAKMKAMTKETYVLTFNKAIDMKITACNGQIIGLKDVTRTGAQAWDTTVKLLRNGIDGTVKASGIVVEAAYEILFGSKT